MKRKRLAMLLALAVTVTSIDSSAAVAMGADFTSEPAATAGAEANDPSAQSAEPTAEENFSDEAGITVEGNEASSDEVSGGESADQDAPESGSAETDAGDEGDELFSDSTDVTIETEEDEAAGENASVEDTNEPEILTDDGADIDEKDAAAANGAEAVNGLFSAEADVLSDGESASIIPTEGVTELIPEQDYTVDITEPGMEKWFSFTPEESGKYIFSSTSEDSSIDPMVYFFNGTEYTSKYDEGVLSDDQGKNSNNDFLLTAELQAGKTYYYCAQSYYEDNRTGVFTVKLSKQQPIASVIFEKGEACDTFVRGLDYVYEFGAKLTVKYDDEALEPQFFEIDSNADFSDSYGNVFSCKIVGENIEIGTGNDIEAGEYTIQLYCNDEKVEGASYPITVLEVNDLPVLTLGNNTVANPDNYYAWYTFTPKETGMYKILEGQDVEVRRKNDLGNYEGVSSISSYSYSLTEGETYCIGFRSCFADAEQIDITLKKLATVQSISASINQKDVIAGMQSYLSGTATVVFDNGETVTEELQYGNSGIYSEDVALDTKIVGEDGTTEYSLGERLPEGTYTLKFVSGEIESNPVEFRVVPMEESSSYYGTLVLGENPGTTTLLGENVYYTFTPESTGMYVFENVAGIDAYRVNGNDYEQIYQRGTWNVFSLEGNNKYCIVLYGLAWDDDLGDYTDVINLSIRKQRKITSISYKPERTEFYTNMEDSFNLSEYISGAWVYYEDGSDCSTFSSGVDELVWHDQDGNYIEIEVTDLSTNEIVTTEDLPVGEYTVRLKCGDVVSESHPLTVKELKFDELEKLTMGDNRITLPDQYEHCYYAFEATETARYAFISDGYDDPYDDDVVTNIYTVNEQGDLERIYFSDGDELKKGKYIVELWDDYGEGGTKTLTISRASEVVDIKISDEYANGLKFLEGIEAVRYGSLTATVTFEDGSSREVKMHSSDEFERELEGTLVKKNEAGEYETVEDDYPPAGSYILQVAYGGNTDHIAEVPVEIVPIKDNLNGTLETGKTQLTKNPDGRLIYALVPETTGRYEFTFNVPVGDVMLMDSDNVRIEVSSPGYRAAWANLEGGRTYYLYFTARTKFSQLRVGFELIPTLSGLKATSTKKNYIAGIDVLWHIDLKTEIRYSDGSTRSVQGQSVLQGYDLQYRAKKDGEIIYDSLLYGSPLTPGTWTVEPYLSTSSVSGSGVELALATEALTINAEFPDVKSLPTLSTGEWEDISNRGDQRLLYSFTAEDSGVYEIVSQDDQEIGSFYKVGEDSLDLVASDTSLKAGEQYIVVISMDSYPEKVRIVNNGIPDELKLPLITENPFPLMEGMKSLVSLQESGREIEGTFTPMETGYYVIETSNLESESNYWFSDIELYCNGEWIADDEGSTDSELLYKLDKGRTYTYRITGYKDDESNDEECRFIVSFNRKQTKKITSAKLIKQDADEEYTIFDQIWNSYQIEVSYDDGTTDILENGDDDYGNEIFIEAKLKSTSEKESIYEAWVEYKSLEEETYTSTSRTEVVRKNPASFTQIEAGKTYTLSTTDKTDYNTCYYFVAPETGEYIIDSEYVNSNGYPELYRVFLEEDYQYEQVISWSGDYSYSYELTEGSAYVMRPDAYSLTEEGGMVSFVFKKAKNLKDLEIKKKPDRTTFFPGSDYTGISLKGIQVEASYSDGSTEEITFEKKDSSGRRLLFDFEEINSKQGRGYITLGDYQVYYDLQAESWDEVQTVKEGTEVILDLMPEEGSYLRLIPKNTGMYKMKVSGGCADIDKRGDSHKEPTDMLSESQFYLEAEQTYYFYVLAKSDKPTVSFTFGDCKWNTQSRTEPTCTEDGLLIELCDKHGDTRETVLPALGHDLSDWKVTVNATCTADGQREKTCSRCDYKEQETIKATGHNWSDWTVEKEATCTEAGTETRSCQTCHQNETQEIKATGHTWGEELRIEPTETTSGKVYKVCSVCGKEEIIKILPATGTDAKVDEVNNSLEEIQNAIDGGASAAEQKDTINSAADTLTSVDNTELLKREDAMETVTKVEELVVEANDNVKETVVDSDTEGVDVKGAALTAAEAAKTAEAGQILASRLSVKESEKSYEDLGTDTHALSIQMDVVDTANGNAVVTSDVEPAAPLQITVPVPEKLQGRNLTLIHVKDDGTTETLQTTLNEDGTKVTFATPSLSDFVLVGGECIGEHTWGEWTEKEAATCTAAGLEMRKCSVCGKEETKILQQLEHRFTVETEKTEATCTESGSVTLKCETCDRTRTEEIPALGHKWKEIIDKEATCTAEGTKHYQCETCESKDDERGDVVIPKEPHDFEETVTKKPTCSAEGTKELKCKNCDFVTEAVIPKDKNAHSFQWKVDKAAACTTDGSRHEECSLCKAKGKTETLKRLGHNFTSWRTTRNATCGRAGEQIQVCGRCRGTGAKKTIPATGRHSLSGWRTVKASTALATGLQQRTCTVCGGAKQTRALAKLKPTIKLSVSAKKSLPLKVKQTYTVKVSGLAKGDRVASWSSSNKKIATVSSKGKITGKKSGKARITVKLRSGLSTYFYAKVQKSSVKTTSLKVTNASTGKTMSKKVTLNMGKSLKVKATVGPVTSREKVTYSSSNKKIVTVSSKGTIKAKKPGTAKVTVKSGKKKVTITVKVPTPAPKKITGVPSSKTLKRGKTLTLKPKLSPSGAKAKITYKSSNKKIATVNSKGKITAKKKGTVTITIKAGKVTKNVKIKVK